MTRRRRGLATGTTLAAFLLITGCAVGSADPGEGARPTPTATSEAAPETAIPTEDDQVGSATQDDAATTVAEPQPVDDEQVLATVLAMDDALQVGDVEAYLTHVSGDLQEEQRAWFQAVTDAALDVRELRLDGVVSRRGCVDDGEPCLEGGTVAHVGLRHQFTGADPQPVLEQYRWVLADLGDGVPVLVESWGRDGDFYGYPQLWDLGEELVSLDGHHVSVLVQLSQMAKAETLLDSLDRAAETTLAELPWVAEGRDRLVVQLAPAEALEEHGWAERTGSSLWLRVSREELPREPGQLSTQDTPVQGHLFLDLDLAWADLEDFGASPGGQTELRYVAAYAATWGEDPTAWPEDWILEGPAYWWSAADDAIYAENLRYALGDHFALLGPPVALPLAPPDLEDLHAGEDFALEALALATYIDETYGRAALIELVGLLIPLDQRHDRDQIAEAYQETLGIDSDTLLDGYTEWTETLPTTDDLLGPPPQGR
ncbi:hypothetical protein [Ornithinimicrobium pratense]|uniref:Uncharacterized protein n=1 Tax=Ornithinimicrobium pratense TaxID=2593973 RepID=A0A5J6V741_9MICO|nr:hypothetical protein [Ornithinimicrobium pratense]QFG69625.1 hypothetical protein FY030_13755 [Ornithinimicrobium pratense]